MKRAIVGAITVAVLLLCSAAAWADARNDLADQMRVPCQAEERAEAANLGLAPETVPFLNMVWPYFLEGPMAEQDLQRLLGQITPTNTRSILARCYISARLAQIRRSSGSAAAPPSNPRTAPAAVRSPPSASSTSSPVRASQPIVNPSLELATREAGRPSTTPRQAALDIAKREGVSALDELLDHSGPGGFNKPAVAKKAVEPHPERPEEPGEEASQCLQLRPYGGPGDDDRLFNTCAYAVEALWCVEGVDCKPSYSNMQSVLPGNSYGMGGTGDGQGRVVRWAACRGRNSIHGGGAPFTHVCRKAPGP